VADEAMLSKVHEKKNPKNPPVKKLNVFHFMEFENLSVRQLDDKLISFCSYLKRHKV
jgi:hypothetical protein